MKSWVGRRGRPQAKGRERYDSGRLKPERIGPSDYVLQRTAFYEPFQGGRAKDEVHDVPGKLWAVELFEGYGADPKGIRDKFREFARLWKVYWRHRVAAQGPDRTGGGGKENLTVTDDDKRFDRMKEIVGWRSSVKAQAFYAVAIDWLDSDEVPPFVNRLINGQRAERDLPVAGTLPIRGDQEKLDLAVEVALDLICMRKPMPRPEDCVDEEAPPPVAHEVPPPLAPINADYLDERGFMRPMSEIADVIKARLNDDGMDEDAA